MLVAVERSAVKNVLDMTYNVSSGTLNSTHSLTLSDLFNITYIITYFLCAVAVYGDKLLTDCCMSM